MTNQHPITPPEELVDKWYDEWLNADELAHLDTSVAAKAARWGADQELAACCEWLDERVVLNGSTALRHARRPKPQSLKEQALTALQAVVRGAMDIREQHQNLDTIRRALEALPND
jgi:hypothetical protein